VRYYAANPVLAPGGQYLQNQSDMTERWLQLIHRVAIVLAALWVVAFYFANKDAIQLSWRVAWSTPNSEAVTKCSDVYPSGDKRLSNCEYAGPGSWADKYLAQQQGHGVLWRYYADQQHDPTVWLWWFGVPIALLLLSRVLGWITHPLRQDRATPKKPR
jgi:hypothetical protein